ncbi:HNH endonuclease [Streptomyces hygroscopicus]|uniref:HNH endonuclease n=1 Tax=Streptomyces hygroscopicus TaxID=1912 RepID=UPI00099E600C|nr:HNH endonuclease [Streptomyces hygroscopicus]
MECLFCKKDAQGSRSVEHVLPESLGNTTMTLPAGTVCDACNNYFAVKVEKPFLESPEIIALRFHQAIPSKKRRIPPLEGTVGPNLPLNAYRYADGPVGGAISVPWEAVPYLIHGGRAIINLPPASDEWRVREVSRFMAKAALESLAVRLLDNPVGMRSLVADDQLDPVREYARYGKGKLWPIHSRRIYDAEKSWVLSSGETVQRVWESDFLQTSQGEVYYVLAIFGLELAINMLGPILEGYRAWLDEHRGASPLYHGKNA